MGLGKKVGILLIVVCVLAQMIVPAAADDMPDGEDKVIYLTFDDGPSIYTRQLLQVLERYGAKATFFLVDTGGCDEALLRTMLRGGHGIGVHSLSHDFKTIYSSEVAYMNDLYAMQALIRKKSGVTTYLMRFPGGSSNTVSRRYNFGIMSRLTKMVEEAGFVYYDWNVDSMDAAGCRDGEQIYQNVIGGIRGKKTAVVLMHDVYACSGAVEQILLWGRANGYRFCALGENSPRCHHPVQN